MTGRPWPSPVMDRGGFADGADRDRPALALWQRRGGARLEGVVENAVA